LSVCKLPSGTSSIVSAFFDNYFRSHGEIWPSRIRIVISLAVSSVARLLPASVRLHGTRQHTMLRNLASSKEATTSTRPRTIPPCRRTRGRSKTGCLRLQSASYSHAYGAIRSRQTGKHFAANPADIVRGQGETRKLDPSRPTVWPGCHDALRSSTDDPTLRQSIGRAERRGGGVRYRRSVARRIQGAPPWPTTWRRPCVKHILAAKWGCGVQRAIAAADFDVDTDVSGRCSRRWSAWAGQR